MNIWMPQTKAFAALGLGLGFLDCPHGKTKLKDNSVMDHLPIWSIFFQKHHNVGLPPAEPFSCCNWQSWSIAKLRGKLFQLCCKLHCLHRAFICVLLLVPTRVVLANLLLLTLRVEHVALDCLFRQSSLKARHQNLLHSGLPWAFSMLLEQTNHND